MPVTRHRSSTAHFRIASSPLQRRRQRRTSAPSGPVQPARRGSRTLPAVQVSGADPHRALARVRILRGQRVLLERDLAFALGTLPGRLADLAQRHADWFPPSARFALSPGECEQAKLWFAQPVSGDGLSAAVRSGAQPVIAYAADGLVSAAHWLANEAHRAADPYAECSDLPERFQLAWGALSEPLPPGAKS